MIILGIDPGSRFLGFGVLLFENNILTPIEYGVLKFNVNEDLTNRLLEIGDGVRELFQDYKPDHVSIEKIFLGKNVDSAFKLGHARGVVIYEALKAQAEVFEYATRLVKKGITGNGSAEKDNVRVVIQNILKIPPVKSLDASDALALACFHSSQLRLAQFKKRQAKLSEAKKKGK